MSHKYPSSMSASEPSCQESHHLRRPTATSKSKREPSSRMSGSGAAQRDPGPKGDSAASVRLIAPNYSLPVDREQGGVFTSTSKVKTPIAPSSQNMLNTWADTLQQAPPAILQQLQQQQQQMQQQQQLPKFEPETWGRILRTQASNENLSGFSKFDPLRTIHFLGKELQSQLQNNLPYNSTIFNVISEMQSALKRIPQDIQLIADTAVKKQSRSQYKEKNKSKHESCQTPNMWYLEPVRLQQHLEESSEKIEKACQQMEVLCSKLKSEKESLEVQLKLEKESSALIKHQLEDFKVQLQRSNIVIDTLRNQNRDMKIEMEKQKAQMVGNDAPSALEFKMFLKDLQTEKEAADEENTALKHQIQVMRLETQKYDVLLQARDLQVKEIRDEMTQLQEIVNEQLIAFQNLCPSDEGIGDSSPHGIHSNHTQNLDGVTNSLEPLCVDEPICAKATMTSVHSESVQELFNNRFNQYDAHSAVGSANLSDNEHLGEMLELNVDASALKLRHVYKMPVSVAVGVSGSCTRRDSYYGACPM